MTPEQVTDEMESAAFSVWTLQEQTTFPPIIAAAMSEMSDDLIFYLAQERGFVLVPRDALEALVREIPLANDGSGNAPGHNHKVPGVWDGDNRDELARQKCAWCAAWRRVNDLLAAAPK